MISDKTMISAEFEIIPYHPSLKEVWDNFVDNSKNGTFLLKRDYMDYHADRFKDNSFLFYRKGKLYCLLPACRQGNTLFSHAGLTYGGIIMNNKCSAEGLLIVFDLLIQKMKEDGINKLIYKTIPYIYHSQPSEEDLYALFRNKARLSVRNISTTIDIKNRIELSNGRKDSLRKAGKNNIVVEESDDFEIFWKILTENLKTKYHTNPTHSLEEIKLVKDRFRNEILLFLGRENETVVGGILCYVTKNVVHSQYISANQSGKEKGVIDAIMFYLLNDRFKDYSYFDFGTSCENGGWHLNEQLISQKEGFGGRGVCYDWYEIDLEDQP